MIVVRKTVDERPPNSGAASRTDATMRSVCVRVGIGRRRGATSSVAAREL